MKAKDKIAYYHEALSEVDPGADGGLLWECLWRMRVYVRPQEFFPPAQLFAALLLAAPIVFLTLTPLVCAIFNQPFSPWFIFSHRIGLILLLATSPVTAAICTWSAMAQARKHGFGKWDDFGEAVKHRS